MDDDLPRELAERLAADAELAAAWEALTPGRRRSHVHHVGAAKQAATRHRRVEAAVGKILAGLGWNERPPSSGRSRPAGDAARPGNDGPRLLSGGNPQIPKGDGPEPVEAYLAALPGWKEEVARTLHGLVVEAVPDVRQAVRWNSPFYGTERHGWFASLHAFDRHLKVTFLNGRHLDPLPPIDSKDPDARYAHVGKAEPIDRERFVDWFRQAADRPAWKGF